MSKVEKIIAWLTENFKDPQGSPYSIVGREDWLIDFFRAIEGFKAWPIDKELLCEGCRGKIGEICDYETDLYETREEEHLNEYSCMGLLPNPILVILLIADRRGGKTFNVSAFATCKIANEKNEHIMYLATGEDHTAELVSNNIRLPIKQSKKLNRILALSVNKVTCPPNHSTYEFTSTSHRAVTGRGINIVIIDEARDVPFRTVAALMPSTQDRHGVSCGSCSYKVSKETNDKVPCPQCGGQLRRWYGRLIIMTAPGILTGDPMVDWINELKLGLEKEPDPNAHVIQLLDNAAMNPDIDPLTKTAFRRIFSKIPGVKALLDAELDAQFRQMGDKFLSPGDIDSAVLDKLKNVDSSLEECIAFLDTSVSQELTSFVICENVNRLFEPQAVPFEWMYVRRIDIWNPKRPIDWPTDSWKEQEKFVRHNDPDFLSIHTIDEKIIQQHLDWLIPRFPNMLALWVDTRFSAWGQRLVALCNRERRWGGMVAGFDGVAKERDTGWTEMENKLLPDGRGRRRTRIPNNPRLIAELKIAESVFKNGRFQIREPARRRKAEDDTTQHLDVSENLATLHWMAFFLGHEGLPVSLTKLNESAGPREERENREDDLANRLLRKAGFKGGYGDGKGSGTSFSKYIGGGKRGGGGSPF